MTIIVLDLFTTCKINKFITLMSKSTKLLLQDLLQVVLINQCMANGIHKNFITITIKNKYKG